MKNTKRKTKKRGGIRPVFIVILIAALLLACYAAVQLRRQAAREADPYYGMVEVFNGDDYVWITPQDGVALNDLDKSEFINDASGNLTYTGREYKASRGVDVSSYQGDIDWQQVYDSGVRFAIVRAGGMYYGSGELYTDDNFIKNIEGAKAAGLRVGAYFFSQATNESEAREEAAFVLDAVRDCPLDYPIAYDWEFVDNGEARTNGMTSEDITVCAKAFCEAIKSAGKVPVIYFNCETGYFNYDLPQVKDYDFWLAEYYDTPSFYYNYKMWQYSKTGSVDGISGDVDMNISIVDFSGSALG